MFSTSAPWSTAQVMASPRPAAVVASPDATFPTNSASVTRTGRILAAGARPRNPMPFAGAAATMLATAVPWPTQSVRPSVEPSMSCPCRTRWPNVASGDTPESITATVSPVPSATPVSPSTPLAATAHGTADGSLTVGAGVAVAPHAAAAAAGAVPAYGNPKITTQVAVAAVQRTAPRTA